jgi:hypothetical protein
MALNDPAPLFILLGVLEGQQWKVEAGMFKFGGD